MNWLRHINEHLRQTVGSLKEIRAELALIEQLLTSIQRMRGQVNLLIGPVTNKEQ